MTDLTGKRFGRLTAIKEVDRRNKDRYYLCQCDCGNKKEVSVSSLNARRIQSCGCLRLERHKEKTTKNLTGKRFERLLVIEQYKTDEKTNGAIWRCQCDCGTIKNIPAKTLVAGTTKSCGCLIDVEKARKQMENLIVDGVRVPKLKAKLHKNNTSGVKGVHITKDKKGEQIYVAKIQVKGKVIHLGSSYNLNDAVKMRKDGERKYHKPYIEALEEDKNDN